MRKSEKRKRPDLSSWADLSDFKDIHHGSKCFLVGAGPSIAFFDLTDIHDHVVISVNSSALLMPWDKEGDQLRRFWISNDVLCLRWDYFWSHVQRAHCTKIVRTSWKKHYDKVKNFRFFAPRKSEVNPLDPKDPGLCSVSSIPTGLDFALWLGCKQIYLLGVDQRMTMGNSHFWQFWNKSKWPQRGDKGRNFRPEQKHQKVIFDENYEVFRSLKEFASTLGAEVYNCNVKSSLKVFDYLSLDKALKK